ncbi:MAG: response regulator, partial [Desulfobulbaceae bacterium]|nr:response regulator [Desulfobulbaceae bacterium]
MSTRPHNCKSKKPRILKSDTIRFLGALERLQAKQNSRPARILLVDDDERHRESLRKLLSLVGYDCLSAGSGREAMELLEEQHVDLLLLDLLMPGMEGHRVMELVLAGNVDAAIVVISGDSTWTAVTRAMRRGADNFIRKPYAPDEVLSAIEKSLKKSEHRKKLEQKLVR